MSQTFLETDLTHEHEVENHGVVSAPEPGALALSAADFSALEERVVRDRKSVV